MKYGFYLSPNYLVYIQMCWKNGKIGEAGGGGEAVNTTKIIIRVLLYVDDVTLIAKTLYNICDHLEA